MLLRGKIGKFLTPPRETCSAGWLLGFLLLRPADLRIREAWHAASLVSPADFTLTYSTPVGADLGQCHIAAGQQACQ